MFAFTPTNSKRYNELIGLVLFTSALLTLLALGSYSPLDSSLDTAAPALAHAPHNWIGVVGAFSADLLLQTGGLAAFLLPVLLGALAVRWFWSRKIDSPGAKLTGSLLLLLSTPALLGLLPWHWRWRHMLPIEGLLGRILADALIHYFNMAGAILVAATIAAAALYLCTTFSISALHSWPALRMPFLFAAWNRFQDWRAARAKEEAKRQLANKYAAKASAAAAPPVVAPPPAVPKESAPATVIPIRKEPVYEAPVVAAPAPAPLPDITCGPEVQVTARADANQDAKTTMPKRAGSYQMPSSALLARPETRNHIDEEELKERGESLTRKCAEFDVRGQIAQINPGPVVTTYEFKPEAGIKYSRITSLTDDLCLALRAESILIERLAGKSTVGVQVPNREREAIRLREIIESEEFLESPSKLTLALGKNINGGITVANLAAMPHLLIAGSTGSGKSVALNAMLMSMLYKATPDEVRLILVDPKRLELGLYEGLPHLYTPIITEPKLAANALRNAVGEMERRLKLLAEKSVRNIDQYNRRFYEDTPNLFEEGENEERPLPYIVIVIDELADLMMLDQSNVEESITRLAQMARAVGIHLVLATQRPSVDVITGLIKANFPARISFRVATKVDSRTILDGNGAEALLGRGDMLYLPPGSGRLIRLHAPFVAEKEIAAAVEFWRNQGTVQYAEHFLETPREEGTRAEVTGGGDGLEEADDELYQDAVRLVLEFGKASTSLLQRRLRIGYGRAAHLIDLMEKDGIVGGADGPKPREVLKRPDWLSEVEDSLR